MEITKDIKTAKSVQEMGNLSFDNEFNLNAVENLVYNQSSSSVDRMVQPATETQLEEVKAELEKKTEPNDNQLVELIPLFRALLLAIANPSYVDKSANQIRSQVTGTLTTVTTVTTVTNLTNLGTFPADHLQRMDNMTAWATNIRSLIT